MQAIPNRDNRRRRSLSLRLGSDFGVPLVLGIFALGGTGQAVDLVRPSPGLSVDGNFQDYPPHSGMVLPSEELLSSSVPPSFALEQNITESAASTARAASNHQLPSTFTFLDQEPQSCPNGFDCSAWPPLGSGRMTLYRSTETFRAQSRTRTFYLYLPARAHGPVPVLIALHGGAPNTTTASLDMLARKTDELADGRTIRWRRNSADCKLSFPQAPLYRSSFQDQNGQTCEPLASRLSFSQAFAYVLPDGIQDDPADPASTFGQHWEDGRTPSPGQLGSEQVRDDVGFINHILDVLIRQNPGAFDTERIYLSGGSNGGMMVQRVACHASSSRYPRLRQIAAFAAQVAVLPQALRKGTPGSEECALQGKVEVPIALFLGKNVATPQCETYGCKSPTVSGDSRMPYGTPGGLFKVNSPDSGQVLAAADTQQYWIEYNAALPPGGKAVSTMISQGYFTEVQRTSFPHTQAQVHVWVTDGGLHGVSYPRGDYNPYARTLEFLFSFRRDGQGRIHYAPSSGLFFGDY